MLAFGGRVEVVKLLLKNEADVTAVNNNCRTPLYAAASMAMLRWSSL